MTVLRLYGEWFIGFAVLFIVIGLINGNPFPIIYGGKAEKAITQMIMADSSDYKYEKGDYVQLYYKDESEYYKDMILRMADTYFPLLAEDFDYEIEERATLILYSSKKEMAKDLKMKITDVPMGAYCDGVLSILSPELWVDSENEVSIREKFMEDGPVVHELTHFVLDKKVSGNYPLWFTEGVALYYEYKYLNFEWRKDLSENATKITLDKMEKNFKALETGAVYRKSFEIIKEIVDSYGEETLQSIVTEMSEGNDFKKSYTMVTGEKTKW